jgi:DNA ligase (NAD+)
MGFCDGVQATNHMEFLAVVQSLGIPTTPRVECFSSDEAAIAHCNQLVENLHDLDFEVDGLVVKVNSLDQRETLGSTTKSPRWVIAYKIEKYEAVRQGSKGQGSKESMFMMSSVHSQPNFSPSTISSLVG